MIRGIFTILIMSLLVLQPCLAAQDNAEGEEYLVGIDDILEINILQPEKLTVSVTVSPDGSISFPYIGNVRAKGLTLKQIQSDIENKLADGYMKYPLAAIFLKESRSRKFFVSGDIAKPGAYPLEADTTVLKAISIAGGFLKNGAFTRAKILRRKEGASANYETIEVNIKDAIAGLPGSDPALKPQDTVMVTQGKFLVYGDVASPGIYPMEEETTVLKAIAIAGGFSKLGSSSRVKILRPKDDNSGNETIEVNIKEAIAGAPGADPVLKAQDTVMISQGKFFVYGEVASPGAYPIEEETTVLKAIAIAGGFTKFGSSARVKILRPKDDNSGNETINVNIKEIMNGSSGKDITLKPGDTVVILEGII